MKFALVDAEKATYSIAAMCESLAVSRSGFYAWQTRPESTHAVEDRRLGVLVRAAHERAARPTAARAFTPNSSTTASA